VRHNRTVVLALAAVAFACKGDSGTGPSSPTYETIAGTYAGSMAGTSQAVLLQAAFTLTGPVDIFNASCQVVLMYANSTIILRR